MEVSSVQRLCLHLISAAFQRCRVSEDLCRLSVVLKRSSDSDPSTVRISSILHCAPIELAYDVRAHKHADVALISSTFMKFCHEVIRFFQKILVLKIPVSSTFDSDDVDGFCFEISEEGGVPGSQYRKVFLANECNPVPFSASNVERLKSGLEDYVMKHGNSLHRKCDSCFPNWEHLKVGSGRACCAESHRSAGLQMEVVIIVSEISETSPCFRSSSAETEVLYFKDFSPCPITQSSLTALTNIDWKSYGLVLKSIAVQGGYTALEWENLPPNIHIDMVLHCYHKQYQFTPPGQKTRSNRNLIKKAAKLALEDLKEKHAGAFLSAHALKICSYAPDLARTIAGLILSSNDSEFQEECFSILGLQSQNIINEIVEDSIQQKIISVIQMNDGKPLRSKEAASSFLFEDERLQEPNIQEEEYDAGELVFSSLDF
ncbi:Type 2 DNA topoisomerase 6 subunit B-like [Citrus sinensis]|uniref:Type 2 DNA topoisomerase 6 subunit B-like n=1 Tax=Citrus sinensis TaxID=2711 RepID=A0ACB8LIF2_CITSI|nr:Type 2 DNA topoisomerase 6 subunit B-like [Citrus sinensis]